MPFWEQERVCYLGYQCGKHKQQMFLYTPWILSKVCLLKLLSEEIIFICFASNTELDISTQSIWLVSGFKKKFVNLFSLSQQSNPMQSIFCNIATQFAHHSFCSIVILYWKILQTGFFSKSVYTEEDDVIILRMPVSDTESEYLEKFQVIKRWTGSK